MKEKSITQQEKVKYLVTILRTVNVNVLTDYMHNLGIWDDDTYVTEDRMDIFNTMDKYYDMHWEMEFMSSCRYYFVKYNYVNDYFTVTGIPDSADDYEKTLGLTSIAADLLEPGNEDNLNKLITWFTESKPLMDDQYFVDSRNNYYGAELITFLEPEKEEKVFDYRIDVKIKAKDADAANSQIAFAMKTLKDNGSIDEYSIG